MSLESTLQLLSCVTETLEETVRNYTERVSSRFHLPLCTNLGGIETKSAIV